MLNKVNCVLLAALAVAIGAIVMTRGDYSRPNLEVLPDMKYSPAYATFSPNPHFANGRTLQAPVDGTIARGQMPLHYEATKEDAIRAGKEIQNPSTSTSTLTSDQAAELRQTSLLRGGDLYRIYCVVCHGATGAGDGPVAQRGFPPPPSLLTGNSRQMKDGQLFHILSYGQGNMPSLSAQVSPVSRWDVINYVRSMQRLQDTVE